MPEREAILLVRCDGVGDAALCIPSLEGLRRAFPQAVFGAVCSAANSTLFSNRVDRVYIYDEDQPVAAMRAELLRGKYTKALIATEEVAGYQIGRLSGAPQRAGFWHRLHKPFKSLWQRSQVTAAVYRPAAWTKAPEHEVQTIYRLAVALGAEEPAPRDAQSLRTWLRVEPSEVARSARGAIGFQITPKLVTEGLGPSGLATVVTEALAVLGGRRGILIASAADESLACAVFEHVPVALKNSGLLKVAVSLSLSQWLGVLDAVDALVTPDTGAAHVAGMLGNRLVDIFHQGDFERLEAQWHPWAGSWRCHAKRAFDMEWDAAAYGRFVASEVNLLLAQQESRPPAPIPTN